MIKTKHFLLLLVTLTSFGVHSEVGIGSHEVLIGTSSNITGPSSARHMAFQNGAKLYIDKFNGDGGAHKRTITRLILDDKNNPKLAADNAERFIQKDKVFALFQFVDTAPSGAVVPTVGRNNIPFLFAVSGTNSLSFPTNKNIFNIRARYDNEAAAIAGLAVRKSWKRIGVIFQNDPEGIEMKNSIAKALTQKGIKLVGEGGYPLGAKVDFSPAITHALQSTPDALFVAGAAPTTTTLLNIMILKGIKHPVICMSACVSEDFPGGLNGKLKDLYTVQSLPTLDSADYGIVTEYVNETIRKRTEKSRAGFEGFINAKVFAEALRRNGPQLTRESLRNTFDTKFAEYDLGGVSVSFSKDNHQGLKRMFLYHIENGSMVEIKNE